MTDHRRQGRILVLGASGRIASMMRERAVFEPSTDVVWQYRAESEYRQIRARDTESYFDPIRYSQSTIDELRNIDTVVCLAGISSGTEAELSLNTQLAAASLGLAEELSARRLFYCSSAAVYRPGEGVTEQDLSAPDSAYGQSKVDAEKFLSSSKTSVSIVSMRMANALFADAITGQLRHPVQDSHIYLDFFPDGNSLRRSYIDPLSLGNIIELLSGLSMPSFIVLNVASIEAIQADELLDTLGVPWSSNYRSSWDGQNITLSTKLLRGMLGISNPHRLWTKALADWGDLVRFTP